jgi:hypothetical protein
MQEVSHDLGVLQPRTLLYGFVARVRFAEALQYETTFDQAVQP